MYINFENKTLLKIYFKKCILLVNIITHYTYYILLIGFN